MANGAPSSNHPNNERTTIRLIVGGARTSRENQPAWRTHWFSQGPRLVRVMTEGRARMPCVLSVWSFSRRANRKREERALPKNRRVRLTVRERTAAGVDLRGLL